MKNLSRLLTSLTIILIFFGCGEKENSVDPDKNRKELKISVNPEKPKTNETITLIVQLLEKPNKCVWEYEGDNSPYIDTDDNTKKQIKIKYQKAGTYSIKFTVTYEDGSKQTASADIIVEKKPDSEGINNKMTLKVEKIDDKVIFNFDTKPELFKHIWVDLNNNGKKDEGEEGKNGYAYTCKSKTINIYGSIKEFHIFEGKTVTSFDAGYNNDLLKLKIRECQKLSSLKISKNTNLTSLIIDNTFKKGVLSSINISKNTNLQYLSLYNLNLTKLDISKNTELLKLDLWQTKIPALDVNKNTKLTSLTCYEAGISKLDVTKNIKLQYLACSKNKIKNLDVSANTKLYFLGCYNNLITNLDISKNTKITKLYCNDNPELSKLNVANGNNANFKKDRGNGIAFDARNCGKLKCIKIDKGYTPKETGKYNLWKKDSSTKWNNSGNSCND